MKTNDAGCGFHVDDSYFWPASHESTGVNFWLALSPMRASEGGGIRVVKQSLIGPAMLEECKNAIFEPEGITTCKMETLSPKCYKKMLESSVVFDMEPGDALIWDRWTFHRSEPFLSDSQSQSSSSEGVKDDDLHRLRYTIRYVPGTAKAEGFLHESQQSGEVFNSAHYPQVWPTAIKSEIDAIQKGLENVKVNKKKKKKGAYK